MYSERFQVVTANLQKLGLQYPYALQELSGISVPGTRERTTRAPFQDGDTYLGASSETRVLNLVLLLKGCTRGALGVLRRRVAATFNAKASPLQLRAFLEDDSRFVLRQLTCQGPIEGSIVYEGDKLVQKLGIRLVAHDPMWYAYRQSTAFLNPVQQAQLTFPITFGIGGNVLFGASLAIASVTVTVHGDWDAAPTIEIPGPISRPILTNATTNETIQLNYNVAVGETVYIDTTPGAKDIYNNYGARLQVYLADGDFATFHLEPNSLVAPGGLNYLTLWGASSGAIHVLVRWYDRYTGI